MNGKIPILTIHNFISSYHIITYLQSADYCLKTLRGFLTDSNTRSNILTKFYFGNNFENILKIRIY